MHGAWAHAGVAFNIVNDILYAKLRVSDTARWHNVSFALSRTKKYGAEQTFYSVPRGSRGGDFDFMN